MSLKVSVVTPAFNSERTISRVIRSVAAQSGASFEHIIIDDGSNDATVEIVKGFISKYAHIRLIEQRNQGPGPARNTGISVADGEYIAFLDADDFWEKDKLALQLNYMDSRSFNFTYGDYIELREGKDEVQVVVETPNELCFKDLLLGCSIGCLTVAYSQKNLGKLYMPSIKRGQDWALWLSITKDGEVAHRYPGVKAFYTVQKGSVSSNKLKKIRDVWRIYRFEQEFGVFPSIFYILNHIIYVVSRKKYKNRSA
jgi:teichuronic acid biosynthesis glycosyltransferase TuaG